MQELTRVPDGLMARWPVGLLVVGLLACWPVGLAYAQALPNINSLSVRYNALKTAAKAEGELKAQLDEVDKAIAEARRGGNLGEVRRQIAKGFALLDKDAWTPQLDYRSSLALRSERTVVDSSVPYAMRLEQIYRPGDRADARADGEGVASASACRRGARRRSGGCRRRRRSRELGTFDGVSRDLRESPFAWSSISAAVEDGAMVIRGRGVRRRDVARRDDARRVRPQGTRCEAEGARDRGGHGDGRGARRCAVSRRLHQERQSRPHRAGGLQRRRRNREGGSDARRLRRAARIRSRAGPATSSATTCSQGANEIMPYRVYVPKGYAAAKATPLVIALHGLGAQRGFVLRFVFDSCRRNSPRSTAS